MFLTIEASESAFRRYYYQITTQLSGGGETVEVLNLRLTIRLISQKTSDANDYKIFLKFVKDESINEVQSQEQPSKAEQSDPPIAKSAKEGLTNEDYLSIYNLTIDSTEEEIRKAIANILGIKHIERAIESSEKVMEVTDETDF